MFDLEKTKLEVDSRYQLCHAYANGTNASRSPVAKHLQNIMEDALASGYRVWKGTNGCSSNPLMLAKFILNEKGDKLYQIALDLWDLALEFPQHSYGITLTPSSQFYLGERRGPASRTVNVECFTCESDSLQAIENFYQDFYVRMNCVPYELKEEQ